MELRSHPCYTLRWLDVDAVLELRAQPFGFGCFALSPPFPNSSAENSGSPDCSRCYFCGQFCLLLQSHYLTLLPMLVSRSSPARRTISSPILSLQHALARSEEVRMAAAAELGAREIRFLYTGLRLTPRELRQSHPHPYDSMSPCTTAYSIFRPSL